MKRINLSLALLLPFLMVYSLAVSSCGNNLVPDGEVEEGLPASLTITVSTPAPAEVTTKVTDLQETHIESLALLFYKLFDSTQPPRAVIEMDNEALASCEYLSSSTGNYMYVLNVDNTEVTSGYYILFAIANYNTSAFGSVDVDSFKTMSLDDARDFIIENEYESLEITETAMLLTGQFGRDAGNITIKPGENKFNDEMIHLRRLLGKVNFTIRSGEGVTFEPESYEIHNLPTTGTLFERKGWEDVSGTVDNRVGTFPSKTFRSLKVASFDDLLDMQLHTDSTFYFYMYENAQLPKNEVENYSGREQHEAADNQSFMNAPDDATYVVINGKYTGPGKDGEGKVSGDVSYTIHLGDFSTTTGSYNNYTVRRNTKYHYIVTVKGVNKIITEAEADPDEEGYDYNDYDSGAEGELVNHVPEITDITLDSHYETVMVGIPKSILSTRVNNVSHNGYSIVLKTPKGNEIYSYQDNNMPQDAYWVKFVKPVSKDELPAYPGTDQDDKIANIYELVNDFVAVYVNYMTPKYFIEDGDMCYVAAFVDEYVYEDGTPLKDFVNTDDREMTLTKGISISADGKSVYVDSPVFSLKQHSIISPFNLDYSAEDYNPSGIEYYEEYGKTIWQSSNYSNNSGKYNTSGDSYLNGYSNTISFLPSNAVWSNYVDPATFGHFNNGEITASAFTKDGNSGMFQCLSRNRDENGNGTIDEDEVKWYLPAVYQCQDVWYGYEIVPRKARLDATYVAAEKNPGYFTSTGVGSSRVWYIDEGTSYSGYTNDSWVPTVSRVRCARSLVYASGEPSLTTDYDAQNMVVDMTKLNPKCRRLSGSQMDEYVHHFRGDDADVLPDAIEIAEIDLNTIGYDMYNKDQNSAWLNYFYNYSERSAEVPELCNVYYNNYDGNLVSKNPGIGWRTPNEKELGVCVRYRDQITTGRSFYANCSRTSYKYLDGSANSSYYFNGTVITVSNSINNGNTDIRCVRDATPYLSE